MSVVKGLILIVGVTLFLITWAPLSVNSSAVLIADFEMTRMIELAAKQPFCKVHTDRGDIQRMLLAADPRRIRQVPRESVMSLENVCHDAGGTLEEFQGGLGFIYPGTKWCGPGNLATDYTDLGKYSDEDRCCREHDLCPNTLSPGECRRGLCNTGTFTRSHCDCDARFRRCLQSLNSEIANTLGAVFFNVVQVTCFRERSPCSVWQRFGSSISPSDYNDTDTSSSSSVSSSSTPSLSSPTSSNNDDACPLILQSSEFYIPQNNQFLSRIINVTANSINRDKNDKNKINNKISLIARSLDLLHGNSKINQNNDDDNDDDDDDDNVNSSSRKFQTDFEQISTRIGIKLASLGLVATNLVKEMVNWPVKDVVYLIQKMHERHKAKQQLNDSNSITQNGT